jgi:4-carboxymuconolactone decarboxylase
VADARDSFEQGLRLIQRMGGQERPAVLDLFESIGERDFGEECIGFIYGDVYHRPGLSLPERQLVTVGALIALGYAPSQLQFHAKAALTVGCTRQQIMETVIHLSSFVGFPATLNAFTAVQEAFAEAEEDPSPAEPEQERRWSDIDDRYERGLIVLDEVDGAAGRKVVEAVAEIAPDLARLIIEFTFGEIYPRPGLSLRHRELVSVAALVALGSALPQLKVHLKALVNVGGTRQEAVETVLHLAFYTGFPAALNVLAVAREVFGERAPGH